VDPAYRAVHGFRPVEELAELADGPTECKVGRGVFVCLELQCDWSAVLTVADKRTRPNPTLSLH